MSDIIDRLKQVIKETLSPEEYEQYLLDLEKQKPLKTNGYYLVFDD